jgi:hypothetical protein
LRSAIFIIENIYLTNLTAIAVAANHTAAPPARISSTLRKLLEAADNAKRMEKRQVILLQICFILFIN